MTELTTLLQSYADSPLLWITITLGAYEAGVILYEKLGKNPVFHPMVIAAFPITLLLYLWGVDHQTYDQATDLISFMLGPAVVALAI